MKTPENNQEVRGEDLGYLFALLQAHSWLFVRL